MDPYNPVTPEPIVVTRTRSKKWKKPGDPTSWSRKYRPPRAKLDDRVVSYYANRGQAQGATKWGSLGAFGGALGGAALGTGAGLLTRDPELGAAAVLAGTTVGMVGGAVGGAYYGGNRGFAKGKARGKYITGMIPKKGGRVVKLAAKEPRAAKRFFVKKKHLKKHQKAPYHQDFKYRTKTTTTSVIHEPDPIPGSMRPPTPKINISHEYDKGTRRQVAPIKTGYAKYGYYREDLRESLIEAIVEASFVDKLYIPKNEKERQKLAKRGTAAHIAHGAARFAAGAPFLLGGGVWNALRYAHKVDAAKKGHHREQPYFQPREEVIEAIVEMALDPKKVKERERRDKQRAKERQMRRTKYEQDRETNRALFPKGSPPRLTGKQYQALRDLRIAELSQQGKIAQTESGRWIVKKK